MSWEADIPDGQTHIRIWRTLFPITVVLAICIGFLWNWYVAFWVIVGGLLHGFGFDPDLDLEGISRGEALWIRLIVFIPLIGWSTFYSRILQKWGGHRSLLSHGFFISTFIRLMFFGLPFVYVFRIYFLDSLWREFLGMFIGLSVSDSWHILADMMTGEMRFMSFKGNAATKGVMHLLFGYSKKTKRNYRVEETLDGTFRENK